MIYFKSYLRYFCALLICAWKINDIGFKGVNRPELQVKGCIKKVKVSHSLIAVGAVRVILGTADERRSPSLSFRCLIRWSSG